MEKLTKMVKEVYKSSTKKELKKRIDEFFSKTKGIYDLDLIIEELFENEDDLYSLFDIDIEKEIMKIFTKAIAQRIIKSDNFLEDVNIVLEKTPEYMMWYEVLDILKNIPLEYRNELYKSIRYLDKRTFKDDYIIMALDDDKIKINYIKNKFLKDGKEKNNYNEWYILTGLVESLNSDEEKIKLLNKLSGTSIDEDRIIVSISNDKTKIKILKEIEEKVKKFEFKFESSKKLLEKKVVKILKSIKDDSIALKYLEKTGRYEFKYLKEVIKDSRIIKKISNKENLTKKQIIQLILNIEDKEQFEKLIINTKEIFEKIKKKEVFNIGLSEKLKFGIELEVEGLEIEKGLKFFKMIKEKDLNLVNWKIREEETLENGIEAISPILSDKKEDLYEIEYMCELLKKIGCKTKSSCGGHIHYGADFLNIGDGGIQGFNNLKRIWQEGEEIFYKMANEEGDVVRDGANIYASGISNILSCSKEIIGEEDYNQIIKKLQNTKHHGINFCNIKKGGKNTVEFRIPNGTINPEEIKKNIYLFGRIMTVSREMALFPEKYEEKMENLKKQDVSEREKVEAILDLLFVDEKNKSIYRNRWDSVKEEEEYKWFRTTEQTFRRGDFSIRSEKEEIYQQLNMSNIYNFENYQVKNLDRDDRDER